MLSVVLYLELSLLVTDVHLISQSGIPLKIEGMNVDHGPGLQKEKDKYKRPSLGFPHILGKLSFPLSMTPSLWGVRW